MSFVLPQRARVVRRLTPSPISPSVSAVQEEWFASYLMPPQVVDAVAGDESPRGKNIFFLRYAPPIVGPSTNAPRLTGERVESEGETWELLGKPRQLRTGRRVVGLEVAVQTLNDLYPWTAELQNNDGSVLAASVPLALWGTTEEVTNRGGYEDLEGEAPVEFASLFRPNRFIIHSGVKLHITRAWIPPDAPRARITVRRKDRNG